MGRFVEVAVPGKHVFTLDGAHRICVDFARDCQGNVETFLRIKRLIEALYAGEAVGIRLDIWSDSVRFDRLKSDVGSLLVSGIAEDSGLYRSRSR
jgi:hypothetical protein